MCYLWDTSPLISPTSLTCNHTQSAISQNSGSSQDIGFLYLLFLLFETHFPISVWQVSLVPAVFFLRPTLAILFYIEIWLPLPILFFYTTQFII